MTPPVAPAAGSMGTLLAAAIGLAVALTTPAAAAPPPAVLDLPDTPAELTLDPAWTPIALPTPITAPPVAAWRHPSGATLVVTRAAAPNPDAWRSKTRDAHLDDVEAGTRAAAPGYRRRDRRSFDASGVPAMDLSFRRATGAGREVVSIRFLFFRTHTVSAAVAVPEARWRRAERTTRAALAGLALPAGYQP